MIAKIFIETLIFISALFLSWAVVFLLGIYVNDILALVAGVIILSGWVAYMRVNMIKKSDKYKRIYQQIK